MVQRAQPDHNERVVRYGELGHVLSPQSAYPGTGVADPARKDSKDNKQRQVIDAQRDGSAETHGISYNPSGLTPPSTPLPHSMTPPPSEDLSDEDIRASRIPLLLDKEMEPNGKHAWCYKNAEELPPITPESLAELDMPRVINNPKLRHDVNFDRELHFRPNLDGSKGKQKIQQTNRYWKALEAELIVRNLAQRNMSQFPDQEAYWQRVGEAALKRLPKIFLAIRDIIKTLVPDYDQKAVQERLDVDHLMQQIRNGVCDLIDLASWLAKILKKHCAPMRDSAVDRMQEKIKQGATVNDPKELVKGLGELMNILEAMKLDVANHQIRHMRPLLIDDTINFQLRYNTHRIDVGKITPPEARNWLFDNVQPMGCEPTPLLALTRGLVYDLLYNDSSSWCPQTFYLDSDRLRALRIELHSRVYHAICREVLQDMALSSGVSEPELAHAADVLQGSIAAIVGVQGKFADRLENIAVEIVRVLLVAEGRLAQCDADLVTIVEHKLRDCLRQDCHVFRQNSMNLAERLIPKIQSRVRDNVKLSALQLQDLFVPPPAPPQRPPTGFGAVCEPVPLVVGPVSVDPDEDMVRRFTHIIALHWQVWAGLVYLAEPTLKENESGSENGTDTDTSSRTGQPTIHATSASYGAQHSSLPHRGSVAHVPNGLETPESTPQPDDGTTSSSNPEQTPEDSLDSSEKNKQRQPA